MAINKQPPFEILPAYRPVAFELYFDALTSNFKGENAVVTVYKNGIPIITKRYKSARNTVSPLSPLDTRWFFDVDIQKYCQDTLAPYTNLTSTFVDPAANTIIDNQDMYATYYIAVTYEVIDLSTALLEDSGIDEETSDEFVVFSASKGNTEGMFLTEYHGTFAGQNMKFLTKSERTLEICKDANAYLSFITPPDTPDFPDNINYMRVQLYNSSGVLLSEGARVFGGLKSKQFTLNTGVDGLSNLPYLGGTPDFTDTELSYYTITIGVWDNNTPLSTFTEHSEVFTYKLKPSCCISKTLRLHWLNKVGGVDSFTFEDGKDFQVVTSSQRGKQALGWNIGSTSPHKASSEGLYKYDSMSIEQYLVSATLLKNSEALFLSDLLSSPKVYIDIDNTFELVACVVEDITQSVTRNDGKIPYNLLITLSNNPINHRL